MTTVLLINQETIPHYRVRIYGYLASKMERQGHRLTVVSAGIQDGCEHSVRFAYEECPLSFWRLARVILRRRPDVVIYWVKLIPVPVPLASAAQLSGSKQSIGATEATLDGQRAMWLKRLGHAVEFWLSDVLLLYASHLRRHISAAFHRKVVIANNTLCFEGYTPRESPHACLAWYGISTSQCHLHGTHAKAETH